MNTEKTHSQNRASRRVLAVALAGLCVLGLWAPAAQAQDEWEYTIVPMYLWALSLDGEMVVQGQTVPFEITFKDAFDRLALTATVHFEAWKGDWGILTDLSFVELSDDVVTPTATVQVDFENFIGELAFARRLGDSDFSVLFGARYYQIEPKLIFRDTLEPLPILKHRASVLDGIVGLLWRPQITDKWAFAGRFDIGTGDTDLVWNAAALFEYRFKPKFGVLFGYRFLAYDLNQGVESEIADYDVDHFGPMMALSIHF